jgi:FlaA1/EpsC-like NDP-sugar epimerase
VTPTGGQGASGHPLPEVPRGIEGFAVRHLGAVQVAVDAVAWAAGLAAAEVLRFEFALDPDSWSPHSLGGLLTATALAAFVHAVAGAFAGLYRKRYHYGSFEEITQLVRTIVVATAAVSLANRLGPRSLVPTSVPLIGGVNALVAMTGARYLWRLVEERRLRPSVEHGEPVLVLGAGEGGHQVITSMLRTPDSPYVPVGIVDDDPTKRNLIIRGVPVVGNRTSLVDAARELGATTVVVAIPSASPELLRQVSETAMRGGLHLRVLPGIHEIFGGAIGVSDIRPLTEADLLGRHEIDTDIDAIAGYLTARRVLVTGAGGSIGSELCRQIARFAPVQLVMLDRDESALHAVQLSIEGRAMLDSRNLVVADIRDRRRLDEVFAEHRPEVVFHAAALKHLPLLEMHPSEALKTNIHGTQHLLDVAVRHHVDRFVNISTDKAADPTSVLGYSKRIAECLTAHTAHDADGTFLSVRFGNVLGSRGSVLTAFRAQIAAGGPITVTDPDVTRYFMTVEEAVQLVIQAGAVGGDGEALVLDMGEPVRIDDVARRLAAEADRPIEIVYTGLRPGEKLHEVLLGADEDDRRPRHHLIYHVAVPPLAIDAVVAATERIPPGTLTDTLAGLATSGAVPDPADHPLRANEDR